LNNWVGGPNQSFMLRLLILCFFIVFTAITAVVAQYSHDARILGMGGAGTATVSGLAASRLNPANLMLMDREQRWELSIGKALAVNKHGFDINTPSGLLDQFHAFYFATNIPAFPSTGSRDNLLNTWFSEANLTFKNRQEASLLTAGLSYTGKRFGISIAHHIRASSSYEIDRGWFDTAPVRIDNLDIIQRNIRLYTSLRHEIGVGIAWEYDLLSGWISDLGKIVIGIHPKVILPVHYGNVDLRSVYSVSENSPQTMVHSGRLNSTTAGELSKHYRTGIIELVSSLPVKLYPATSTFGNIAGAGGGFDAGITYVIGLGDDVSLITQNRIPLRNSFRISFSITDVGVISYSSNVERLRSPLNQTILDEANFPEASDTEFSGNPYSLIHFLNSPLEQRLFFTQTDNEDTTPIRVLMPSRMHLGSAIQYGPIQLSAEIQYQNGGNQLDNSFISYHIGTELGLLRFLPLRWGMIFQTGEPIVYTAGFGFDMKYLAVNVGGVLFADDATRGGILPTAVAISGLQLRF
jgi:hypothetical protein